MYVVNELVNMLSSVVVSVCCVVGVLT